MWFRLYVEILDDPKVQHLDADLFRSWINLLCVTKRHGGTLPSIEAIAFALRISPDETQKVLQKLSDCGLIDGYREGPVRPHNWNKFQYISDLSTQRVRKHRKAKREGNVSGNANETPTETPPEAESDSEPESEKDSCATAVAAGTSVTDEQEKVFDELWAVRPHRQGSDPKHPAKLAFMRHVRSGVDPQAMIAGMKRYADEIRRAKKYNTEFVVMTQTWLKQRRWEDKPAAPRGLGNMRIL